MKWMETLAKRQGAYEGFTTTADMTMQELPAGVERNVAASLAVSTIDTSGDRMASRVADLLALMTTSNPLHQRPNHADLDFHYLSVPPVPVIVQGRKVSGDALEWITVSYG